jgi:hypothetical protein
MTLALIEQETKEKIALEEPFIDILDAIAAAIALDYLSGTINLSKFDDDLELALKDQYEKVGNDFYDRIDRRLPDDIKATDSEIEEILAALSLYYLVRAPKQRRHIQETTQKNIIEVRQFGDSYARQQAVIGKPVTAIEKRIIESDKLVTHIRARNKTISARETQDVAETAKQAEASVLVGQKPQIIEPNRNPVKVTKTWYTQGDEKVRRPPKSAFNHVAADLQKVDVNMPFTVSDESLMYPGDESLGASLGNIINCRCGVNYSDNDIIGIRRR